MWVLAPSAPQGYNTRAVYPDVPDAWTRLETSKLLTHYKTRAEGRSIELGCARNSRNEITPTMMNARPQHTRSCNSNVHNVEADGLQRPEAGRLAVDGTRFSRSLHS